MKRVSQAIWSGDLKAGLGELTTQSGIIRNVPYSFTTRFEMGSGTNPEELIAAAHAGCFTMAVSAFLGEAGYKAENLKTLATVVMDNEGENWFIHTIHLDLTARVPGIDPQKLEEAAEKARLNCPISRLLNVNITLDIKLES